MKATVLDNNYNPPRPAIVFETERDDYTFYIPDETLMEELQIGGIYVADPNDFQKRKIVRLPTNESLPEGYLEFRNAFFKHYFPKYLEPYGFTVQIDSFVKKLYPREPLR